MPCTVLTVQSLNDAKPFLDRLAGRDDPEQSEGVSIESRVTAILAEVKARGLDAVVEHTRRFDAPEFTAAQFAVPGQAPEDAARTMPARELAALTTAADHIRAFHQEQKERSWFTTRPDGTVLGQMALPVDRAGLYVPGGQGGSTPLLSSLLMNAIPAQVAGVGQVAVISPPRADGTLNPAILAAAHILGITEVYAAGSAWGVAALAYGADPLRPVDVIAGPGNIYVTTAKRLLIGRVGIDMLAGPSEVCVIADDTANPAWVAADMLSQAEHDALASSVCVTPDPFLAKAVLAELKRQCALLPRADIAAASLRGYGAVITVDSMATAAALSNAIAPEHLELLVADPWALLPAIRHAGAVFMGHHSAEPLGDYYAGPNHVLPTMGTARFSSALSVSTFCKKTSIIAASPAFARSAAPDVALLARMEGLEAHARSALCRSGSENEEQ